MVVFGEGGVELLAYFVALQRAGGSEENDFGHDVWDIDYTRCALECWCLIDVAVDFVLDDGDVGAKSGGGESEFDELFVDWIQSI